MKIKHYTAAIFLLPAFLAAQSPACDNVDTPGLICCNQTICPGDVPGRLNESVAPAGGSGALQYEWLRLVQVPGSMPSWTLIPAADSAFFQPGPLFSTEYLLRDAQRDGCINWLASNVVVITVLDANDPACVSATKSPHNLAAVSISPNPFLEKINVDNPNARPLQLRLYNGQGALVSACLVPAGQVTQLETPDWPAGFYLAQLQSETGEQRSIPLIKP